MIHISNVNNKIATIMPYQYHYDLMERDWRYIYNNEIITVTFYNRNTVKCIRESSSILVLMYLWFRILYIIGPHLVSLIFWM